MLADARTGWRMRHAIDRRVAGPFRAWWRRFRHDTVGRLPDELLDLPVEQVTDADLARLIRLLLVAVSQAPEPPEAAQLEMFAAPIAKRDGDLVVRELERLGMPDDVRRLLRPPAGEPIGAGVGIAFEGLDVRYTFERQTLNAWASEGTALIKTIPQELVGALYDDVSQALERGQRAGTLRRLVEHRYDVSEARVQLIVRDQLNKLNGRITEDLQKAAGVEEYTWRSANDTRVRDRHLELNGQRFRWDSEGAPDAGPYGQPAHPGQAIQCRCQAEAVVPRSWAVRARPASNERIFTRGTGRPGRLAS